jgi:methanol--5-hydroxybenzimidazolylcobamide Co-methyltransferase
MAIDLAIANLDEFTYGKSPKPIRCGRGVEIGAGRVIPEINFTLPSIDINPETWQEVLRQYSEMITGICERAVALDSSGILVEVETLPPMTVNPSWGVEVSKLVADKLDHYFEKRQLHSAFRLTPNDTREHQRPPRMRSGRYWEGMKEFFERSGEAGADLLSIESTGGKEINDIALMDADVHMLVFALGIIAPRDMEFLWREIVDSCKRSNVIPAGDSACGFANTAMVLAEQRMLPRVFAALVRIASVPRSLVAFEQGAVGPSKDCAYEGPYIKAITGSPISMEGRTAACAHFSSVGNISQAVCDCWSNESVQNIRLLSGYAPTVCMEQLEYDCRLLNVASQTPEDRRKMRDWLVASDSSRDPQAYVLRPDVVMRIAKTMIEEDTPYLRVRAGLRSGLSEIRTAISENQLKLPTTEMKWMDRLERQIDSLPSDETEFIEMMLPKLADAPWIPSEYGF